MLSALQFNGALPQGIFQTHATSPGDALGRRSAGGGGWSDGWGVFEVSVPPEPVTVPDALAPASPSGITEAEATAFVQSFLAAENKGYAAGLLRFYADRVDYFNRADADQDFIFQDKQAYYRRWPRVENRLID